MAFASIFDEQIYSKQKGWRMRKTAEKLNGWWSKKYGNNEARAKARLAAGTGVFPFVCLRLPAVLQRRVALDCAV
jgi:hypothetical protein